MTATIIDGKAIATKIKQTLKAKVTTLSRPPVLAVVLMGNDPASEVYVRNKVRACEEVGIRSEMHRPDAKMSETALLSLVEKLNIDDQIDGILVQLPLPKHINAEKILLAINPDKDVDGFHPYNIGRLVQRHPTFQPCTPAGVIELLKHEKIAIEGKDAVVVGASNIVGRPMALELLLYKATVTVCHRFTKDLKKHVQNADILIVAIGNPGIIQSDWIKPGATVIDVGMNHREDGSLCGDIDFDTAKERAGAITPVPGGVGPMTIAMLLSNTIKAFEG